ncbi:MAG: FG-GAP-like repeat-containing protein [Phycisphaerae bacterium]|nr:FG-GAP-like repeat-containing protein [Phycisphaerae bacterium]
MVSLAPHYSDATVSDLDVADFDNDGRLDLIVAWFATSQTQPSSNLRRVTLFQGNERGFEFWNEFDVYRPDPIIEVLSVFRNGTAEVTPGDFDGDGDTDFAVSCYFGDEIWFFENRGAPIFEPRLKFMFGTNSPANFLTPPESAAADFDNDGRDDLVYLADPIQHVQGRIVHFWRTSNSIANIYRINWEAGTGARFMQWTRSLAVDDFNGDGRPDLCFTGTTIPPNEEGPVIAIWSELNTQTRLFAPSYTDATFLCADVVSRLQPGDCRPSYVVSDQAGMFWSEWTPLSCPPLAPSFFPLVSQADFSGLSPGRGLALAVADMNGDGHADVVSKQKLGQISDAKQIEISFATGDPLIWSAPTSAGLKTTNFANTTNAVLRPHNLVVADVAGNRLPDVIAGFGRCPGPQPGDPERLLVAIWTNGCDGDVNFDGRTSDADLEDILKSSDRCQSDADFVPGADLNRDGCVNGDDYEIAARNWGCRLHIPRPGDINCDDSVDFADITSFVSLLLGGVENGDSVPIGCAGQDAADLNSDGFVSVADIGMFVELLLQ